MLIGYANSRLQKICEQKKTAQKHLRGIDPDVLFLRINQLMAFSNLGHIPLLVPPLHFHPLRANLAGKYAVTVRGLMRIVFQPVGEFKTLSDGTPDLSTVIEIEIVAVKDYHDQ